MQSQGLAGACEVQLVNKEDIEEIDHDLPQYDVFGVDTPTLGPVIDV
jgi:hypothetical protein